jgi:hypothetical protein
VWVWFTNFSVDVVVTLRLGSELDGFGWLNAYMMHSKVEIMCHTASDVYSYGM